MKILLLALLSLFTFYAHSSTLLDVKARGALNCGVSGTLPGFSKKNSHGEYHGFDVDYCKAVASAIGITKINFVNLTSKNRLNALQTKKVDILSRTTTWTLSRDANGLEFVGTIFYDGEGFMVPSTMSIGKKSPFSNLTFCIREGTTSSQNLKNYFLPKGVQYKEKVYPDKEALNKAYLERDCQIYVLDASALTLLKASFPSPEKHKILNVRISKEPLSPVVRDDDAQWLDIARWTLFLLIGLEENGINKLPSASSDSLKHLSLEQKTFLQSVSKSGSLLGLDSHWGIRIASKVGSYQTIFDKNLGTKSKFKLKRGMNALWNHGGLLYSPPFI